MSTRQFNFAECKIDDDNYVPTPEELADFEEWEQRMRDCYLNRLNGTHATVGEDGCTECGYGAK